MLNSAKYLPRQVAIDAVLLGGFRFADMSHQGSLILLPGRTRAWQATKADQIRPEEFKDVLEQSKNIDILVVGTGQDLVLLNEATRQALSDAGLASEVSATRAAVATYNVLLSDNRRVAAALIALAV